MLSSAPPVTRPSVLIVEDHKDLRESMLEILTDAGLAAVAAVHGQAALSVLRAGLVPCVILLDLQMPVMNGWEFASVCAEHPALRKIPVLVLSANSDRFPLPRGADGDPLDCMRKPIDIELLLERIGEYALRWQAEVGPDPRRGHAAPTVPCSADQRADDSPLRLTRGRERA